MHRGGTSAAAGALNFLGASPPKTLMPADSRNEHGYFESMPLYQLHDQMLASAGSVWHDWRAFNPAWYGTPLYADFRQRARTVFEAEFEDARLAALKDPRICRFVPFWLEICAEMQAQPHVVIPVRSPLEVALSLKKRDGFPLTKGVLLWLRHMLEAEAATRGLPRAIFGWDGFLSDWRGTIERISAGTGVKWPRLSDRAGREIEAFLSRELRHHVVADADLALHPDVHEWAQLAYRALLSLASEPDSNSARAILDKVRAKFEEACGVFGRVVLDYEIAQEQQENALGALQCERDQWLTSAQQNEASLAQARAETAAAAAALAQLSSAHQAALQELAGTLESLRAEGESAAAQLRQREEEIAARVREAQSLAQQRDGLAGALEGARAENEAAAAQLRQREEEIAALAREAQSLAQERDGLAGALESARAENEAAAAQLRQREEEIAALARETQSLAQERDALAGGLEGARAESEAAAARLRQHEEELAALARETQSLAQERDGLAGALESARAENEAAAARLRQREDELAALALETQSLAQERDGLAGGLEAMQAEQAHARHEAALHEEALQAELALEKKARAARERSEAERVAAEQEGRHIDTAAERCARAKGGTLGGLFWRRAVRRLAQRLSANPLFDRDFYVRHYPEVAESGFEAVEHYVRFGFCRGYFPHPLFDTRHYLAANADVLASGSNPLLHYVEHGQRESRNPNAFFNQHFYVQTYADLKGWDGPLLQHYFLIGFRAGYDPGPSFNTRFYLDTYPDVRESGMNPLAHFLHFGRYEGRRSAPESP